MESTAGENRETGKPQKFIDLDPKQEWWGETDKQLTGRKKAGDGMGDRERQSVGS